jgi:hypothetical protein
MRRSYTILPYMPQPDWCVPFAIIVAKPVPGRHHGPGWFTVSTGHLRVAESHIDPRHPG